MSRRTTTAFVVVAAVGFGCFASKTAAAAEKLPPTDIRAIEKLIRDQIDAFGRDDAERAFGYASPDIQRMFGTPDNFMRMVRDNYEPVYRAGSVQFIRLDSVDGQWVQTVQLVDEEGRVWRALFTVKRQANRMWKVSGCQLLETSAIAT